MGIRSSFCAAPIGLVLMLVTVACIAAPGENTSRAAESVAVTILSSNLANSGTVGEWGFSPLVEVDGRCILFDAGNYPDTVLRNANSLGVDLSCATDVVLSHFHADHTTGLLPLLEDLRAKNPEAMRKIHVAEGLFLSRRRPSASGYTKLNKMIAMRKDLEAAGVEFIEYSGPTGMHLYSATDETLLWTSDRLRDIGIQNLMAGHCTGIDLKQTEPVHSLAGQRAGNRVTRPTPYIKCDAVRHRLRDADERNWR